MPKPRISIRRSTNPRSELFRFLGPRNFKGLYTENPLAYTPGYAKYDNRANYISAYPIRVSDRQGPAVNWKQVFSEAKSRRDRVDPLKPFPDNQYCKSSLAISEKLKQAICQDFKSGEMSEQKISFKYGIALPRIEAVLKLAEIEKDMKEQGKISKDMKRMAEAMKQMFTEIRTDDSGVPYHAVDNMTEIPIPKETRHQNFMTIAESEPFGPIDAAQALGIEPAAATLEKLAQHDEEHGQNINKKTNKEKNKRELSFYAPVMDGDKAVYRFTSAKVGEVGHRYGASKDDRKHARKVKYTSTGKMVYA